MAGIQLWMTAAAMAVFTVVVTPYPRGAPESACKSLIPDSHGPSSATGPSPYFLQVSSTTYSPNQVIAITLRGAAFKGFLIVGTRDDGGQYPVGSFQTPDVNSKLACTATSSGNGVTQTNNTVKTLGHFLWKAPSESAGTIRFNFTVVRGGAPNTKVDASDYYASQSSAPLTPTGFHNHRIEKVAFTG
ncbi:hypothetical protein BsWGS_05511 [Bradybaena similaris]